MSLPNSVLPSGNWDGVSSQQLPVFPNLPLFTCPPLPNILLPENYVGGDVFVQTFFEGPPTCQCCKNWVEKEPNEVPAEAKKKYTGAAIILYKSKDHSSNTLGGLKKYEVQTIAIQSPIIGNLISPILGQMGFFHASNQINISAPFKELFHCHSQIIALYETLDEEGEGRIHLKLLVDAMDKLFKDLSYKIKDFTTSGVIDWASLWAIFPKGMIVYHCLNGLDHALEVVSMNHGGNSLACRYVCYDGSCFGYRYITIQLGYLPGTFHVTQLKVYPLSFHPDPDALTQKLHRRGLKALQFQDISIWTHTGNESVSPESHKHVDDSDADSDDLSQYGLSSAPVSGRIVVDAFQAQRFGFHRQIFPLEMPRDLTGKDKGILGQVKTVPKFIEGRRSSPEEQEQASEIIKSSQFWLMLMGANLECFHLKEKSWVSLDIDKLEHTSWNDDAFDRLVLTPGSKELVLSFVEAHTKTRAFSNELIEGKGRGLVILLSGPPGTGKTLTVESLSEKTRRPLYHLQAGDLGSNPASVKSKLHKAFKLCEEWDAILLLDEADALLRSRRQDSTCEDLCCVLLATLEYYSGIIFLTTNLSEDMDDAIVSRLDIHLEYPSLDFDTRRILWENFLLSFKNDPCDNERPEVSVTPEDIESLALWRVNGRDINHAVKNATKWCYIRGRPITRDAIEVGLQVTAPRCQMDERAFGLGTTSLKRKRID
ncbi:P-loop containing nucleoside triphosphate hydrolase protein [Xylaria arbuscula]|nr:P-loop containing nucleoside triphosphate hydrolase protein [Xylaria arbuscula]